ncbi:unnamed protein product, partial [Dicrocoelium dendriticum]
MRNLVRTELTYHVSDGLFRSTGQKLPEGIRQARSVSSHDESPCNESELARRSRKTKNFRHDLSPCYSR